MMFREGDRVRFVYEGTASVNFDKGSDDYVTAPSLVLRDDECSYTFEMLKRAGDPKDDPIGTVRVSGFGRFIKMPGHFDGYGRKEDEAGHCHWRDLVHPSVWSSGFDDPNGDWGHIVGRIVYEAKPRTWGSGDAQPSGVTKVRDNTGVAWTLDNGYWFSGISRRPWAELTSTPYSPLTEIL